MQEAGFSSCQFCSSTTNQFPFNATGSKCTGFTRGQPHEFFVSIKLMNIETMIPAEIAMNDDMALQGKF